MIFKVKKNSKLEQAIKEYEEELERARNKIIEICNSAFGMDVSNRIIVVLDSIDGKLTFSYIKGEELNNIPKGWTKSRDGKIRPDKRTKIGKEIAKKLKEAAANLSHSKIRELMNLDLMYSEVPNYVFSPSWVKEGDTYYVFISDKLFGIYKPPEDLEPAQLRDLELSHGGE